VAATTNKDCPPERPGATVNITSTLPARPDIDWYGGEKCAVVSNPTRVPDPCKVEIEPSAASSIYAAIKKNGCRRNPNTTIFDYSEFQKNGAATGQELAIGLMTCLEAAIGSLAFIIL